MRVPVLLLYLVLGVVTSSPQHEGRRVPNPLHKGDEDLTHDVQWLGTNKATSDHLLHSRKWGRDPELCEEFFLDGAPGACQERDTCCGLLNVTDKRFTVSIYCCHDTEKCCQGLCCEDHSVCCREKTTVDKEGYGQCCDKQRGCCTDLDGNVVCCGTMLGRYWWVIAVILTIYIASKVTMMVRRYRAMPDVGDTRINEDKELKVKIKGMTYCC